MEIEHIVHLLEERDIAKSGDLVGVSAVEIATMETRLGLNFPLCYRQYLLRFGRSAGFLATWMAIYFDDLAEIREVFEQFNQEQPNAIVLPANALLISNLDVAFDYIFCDEQPDPEVFRIYMGGLEGAPCYCEKYAESFSGYLEQLILGAEDNRLHGASDLTDADLFREDDIL